MHLLLVIHLWVIFIYTVSAGGVYCAKTARARAAALGLDYPGAHGAPGLDAPPPHHGVAPRSHPPHEDYGKSHTPRNHHHHTQSQRGAATPGDWPWAYGRGRGRAFPTGPEFALVNPDQGMYDQSSVGWPAGLPEVFDGSRQAKHAVAPPPYSGALGDFNHLYRKYEGRGDPRMFAHTGRALVGETLPVWYDSSLGGVPQSWRGGHRAYLRARHPTGHGDAPALFGPLSPRGYARSSQQREQPGIRFHPSVRQQEGQRGSDGTAWNNVQGNALLGRYRSHLAPRSRGIQAGSYPMN